MADNEDPVTTDGSLFTPEQLAVLREMIGTQDGRPADLTASEASQTTGNHGSTTAGTSTGELDG